MASPSIQTTAITEMTTPSATVTINLPSGVQSGDLVVVALVSDNPNAAFSSWSDGFTELLDEQRLGVAYKQADGTEGSTITVTQSNSQEAFALAWRITGHEDPATQAPEIQHTSSASGAGDPPSITPTGGSKDYLFLCTSSWTSNETFTDYPTNYSLGQQVAIAADAGIAGAGRQLTASSEDPGAFDHTSSAWRASTIAIHPSASSDVTSTPSQADLTLDGKAPAANLAITAAPAQANLTLDGKAPSTSIGVTKDPAQADLVLDGKAPTVTEAKVVAPSQGDLALDGKAPTAALNVLAQPSQADLALDGKAPSTHFGITPAQADLTLDGKAPSVIEAEVVAPSQADLTLDGKAPTVNVGVTRDPAQADLTLDGKAPTTLLSIVAQPSQADLVLDGKTPIVSTTGAVTVTPGQADLVLDGKAPATILGLVANPSQGDIILDGKTPTISVEGGTTVGGIHYNKWRRRRYICSDGTIICGTDRQIAKYLAQRRIAAEERQEAAPQVVIVSEPIEEEEPAREPQVAVFYPESENLEELETLGVPQPELALEELQAWRRRRRNEQALAVLLLS